MFITLEKKDCEKIIDAIIANKEEEGDGCLVHLELNGLSIDVDYSIHLSGYYEDDYENGTGAWVCESAKLQIWKVQLEDNVQVMIDVDTDYIESEVEDYFLNR